MATQLQIAKICGLDVSSVNKILTRAPGPVFRKETIKKVFSVAKRMGYNFDRATKATMRAALERLFPRDRSNVSLVVSRCVTMEEVIHIKKMLYKGYNVAKEGRPPLA